MSVLPLLEFDASSLPSYSRFASPPHEMTSRHVPFSDEVYDERVKELRGLVNKIDSHFTHPFNIPWRTNEKGQMEFARPMAQWAWKTMIIVEGSCSTQADYIYLKELLGSLLEAIKKGENVSLRFCFSRGVLSKRLNHVASL